MTEQNKATEVIREAIIEAIKLDKIKKGLASWVKHETTQKSQLTN